MKEVISSITLMVVALAPALLASWFDPRSKRRRERAKRARLIGDLKKTISEKRSRLSKADGTVSGDRWL